MSVQSLIDNWRTLTVDDRKEFVHQISALSESIELEDEIADQLPEDERISLHDSSSNHYLLNADFANLKPIDLAKIKLLGPNLVFTSPPYNAGIEYDSYQDNLPIAEYIEFLDKSFDVMNEVLLNGGRIIINIRDINIGSGSRLPIIVPLYNKLCLKLGYNYRGVHIWYKGREESSFAWGSYKKSTNPAIIDLFEYLFVFQKGGERTNGVDNLDKTEFIESVLGIWKIRPVKKIIGSKSGKTKNTAQHPCPFPVELVKRAIKLYSSVCDRVLDPFSGIMTTAIAAAYSNRDSISIDISKAYCDVGYKRFCQEHKDLLLMKNTHISRWD